jgi:diacylglycerol kinase family enzyme
MAQGFGEVIPNDGLLEVTVAASKSRLQGIGAMASLFASALVKKQFERDDILCLRAAQINVKTNPPQKIVLDGEMIGTTPVEFRSAPDSVTVFVPANIE